MKAVVDQIVAETYEGLTVAPGISCRDLASATHKWVMSRCQSVPSVTKMSPAEMAHIERIMRAGTGADRQLAVWEQAHDIKAVVDQIVAETYQGLNL